MSDDADMTNDLTTDDLMVRELGPDDADQIIAVFEGLSDHDRYTRFFRPMPTYPAATLELLTGMDGVRHVAVGAFDGDRCVAVARFVATARRPSVAEVAVTVAASHRGRGLAGRLVATLGPLAAARGITEFEVDVLPTNRAAASLFRNAGFRMRFDSGSLVGHRAALGSPGELSTAA